MGLLGGLFSGLLSPAGNAGMGLFGGLADWWQNTQDRQDFMNMRGEALQRMDDTTRYLMEGDPTAGYQGALGLVNQYSPAWQNWAGQAGQAANDIANSMASGYSTLQGQYGTMAKGLQGQYGQVAKGLQGQYGTLEKAINAAYGARTGKAMGMVDQYGNQQKADINERFALADTAAQTGMVSRGLGNTIMGASLKQGSARESSAEQRRLGEDLTRIKLDTYGQFSGDELSTRKALGLGGVDLASQLGLGGVELARQLGLGGIELGGRGLESIMNARQWAAGMGADAGRMALSSQQSLAGLPLDIIAQQTAARTGAMMNWGQPPEVPSFMTRAQVALQPLTLQKMMPQPQSGSWFENLLGIGGGAGAGAGIGAALAAPTGGLSMLAGAGLGAGVGAGYGAMNWRR